MDLIGKALTMSDLVAYSDGSVVSKTLIDKKVGTLTLFSFDAGQGLSEHTAPYDAFVQVVDGEAEVTIAGEPHTVATGQMIIMPANVPHELKALKPFKMLLVMIRA
ncbi:cupin domain-containing protein [Geobacter sp. SVR]|uniref:cupin domain-containing protein n=1 Tax=Geobacter sp. SVR TaxID=2495594 RepID=UPI00143EF8D2|nr:cupin domain-containing protein [Geobacter sp. SVR]BCS55215.1 cupin [Geobacter sp. SVR]GCF86016.1 cupin [Geobacter sp. SVR]